MNLLTCSLFKSYGSVVSARESVCVVIRHSCDNELLTQLSLALQKFRANLNLDNSVIRRAKSSRSESSIRRQRGWSCERRGKNSSKRAERKKVGREYKEGDKRRLKFLFPVSLTHSVSIFARYLIERNEIEVKWGGNCSFGAKFCRENKIKSKSKSNSCSICNARNESQKSLCEPKQQQQI